MPESERSYLVVGDIYENFCQSVDVFKESEMLTMLSDEQYFFEYNAIVLGQGLSKQSVEKITTLARYRNIKCSTELNSPASLDLTHKTDLSNVLISEPICVDKSVYKHSLITNDNFDRLSDHVTGKHIGAMLLMEAARQSVISTLEQEFSGNNGTVWGYVLQRFNTEYLNYAFPVPTEIVVSLIESDIVNRRQISTSLKIEFFQSNECISRMYMDVQLLDNRMLSKVEGKKVREFCATNFNERSEETVGA